MNCNNIKVLFIGNLNGGGRERRMAQLINGLNVYHEYEVKVVVSNKTIDYINIQNNQSEIIFIEDGSRKKIYEGLKSVMDSFRPDIVHMWAEKPRWLLSVSLLKIIYRFKYIAGFVASGSKLPILSKTNISYQIAYMTADRVVSNSKCGLSARNVPSKKSVVIRNGFDFHRLDNIENREDVRKGLSIGNNIVVSMVGRFEPLKDWGTFLNIARYAQKESLSLIFLSIGAGTLQEFYKQKCNEYNLQNVLFLGRRDDIEQLLNASDIFVLFNPIGTRAEGISNAIMEAMAVGLPVVATKAGGTPELVEDGETGFLVKAGDYITAYNLVKELSIKSELRSRLGQNAEKRIREEFSLDKMTTEYIKLYKELINKKTK